MRLTRAEPVWRRERGGAAGAERRAGGRGQGVRPSPKAGTSAVSAALSRSGVFLQLVTDASHSHVRFGLCAGTQDRLVTESPRLGRRAWLTPLQHAVWSHPGLTGAGGHRPRGQSCSRGRDLGRASRGAGPRSRRRDKPRPGSRELRLPRWAGIGGLRPEVGGYGR